MLQHHQRDLSKKNYRIKIKTLKQQNPSATSDNKKKEEKENSLIELYG